MQNIAVRKHRKSHEGGDFSLECRQLHLIELLEAERKAYRQELRSLSGPDADRIEDMRKRVNSLKNTVEEQRQRVAEEKLREHYRCNNPDLREIDACAKEQQTIAHWKEQIADHEKAGNSCLDQETYYSELTAAQRERERERNAEELQQRVIQERVLREIQRRQMEEIRMREKEAQRLRQEEYRILQQRTHLQEVEQLRQEQLRRHEQKEHGRVLLRQHLTVLRRKSKQVQDELEADLRLLSALAEQEETARDQKAASRERAKYDADWMREVVQEQLRFERSREAELDEMFQDEAARIWAKREEEYKKEKEARDRLMKDVLEAQEEQIRQRLIANRRAQEESIEAREFLIEQLQAGLRLDEEDAAFNAQERLAARRDLEEQIALQETRRRDMKVQENLQLEDERLKEVAYQEMLCKEADKMNLVGVPTKDGRKFVRKQ